MNSVRVDICCNDPDNGLFDGRAAAIQLADLELAASDFRGPSMRLRDNRIVIAGKHWPFERSKDWFGNWCWNAYWMPLVRAVELLIWAHGRGFWDVEQAEARIYNMWRLDRSLDTHDDRAFLERYFGKPSTWAGHGA